jgi:hypothetical protein
MLPLPTPNVGKEKGKCGKWGKPISFFDITIFLEIFRFIA